MKTPNIIALPANFGNFKAPKFNDNLWIDLAIKAGLFIGAGYLGYLALRELGLVPDRRGAKEDKNALIAALNKLAKEGVVPNYPDIQYRQWADQTYQAMRNSAIAEKEDAVVEIAKFMNNDADVLKWAESYGTRQHYYFGVNDGAPITLFEALATDLSSSRRLKINQNWLSKNISIRA